MLIKIPHRQRFQMFKHIVAQSFFDAVCRTEQKITPHKTSCRNNRTHDGDASDPFPDLVHRHRAIPQTVGDRAGILGNIHVHQIHEKQRRDSQNIRKRVATDILPRKFQFFQCSSSLRLSLAKICCTQASYSLHFCVLRIFLRTASGSVKESAQYAHSSFILNSTGVSPDRSSRYV